MSAQRHALIVAGGSGARLGSDVPKQFLPLAGIPVVIRSIQAFLAADPQVHVVLVVGVDWMKHMSSLLNAWDLPSGIPIVSGGPTRFESVRHGLTMLPDDGSFVAMHDAARPLVTPELVRRVYESAETAGSAVPVVEVGDSVRLLQATGTKSIPRDTVRIVQTPQCFRAHVLKAAYDKPYEPSLTDCATVIENAGHTIHLVDGEPQNIKITTKSDLQYAQWFVEFGWSNPTGIKEV